MITLKFFKSPTCGPCKMFMPQIKKAIEETHISLQEYDVTTDEGLNEASKYNIRNSGAAVLVNEDNNELSRWDHPAPANVLISKIQEYVK